MQSEFSKRLRQLRGDRSQAVFSKEMGVIQQTYANWEQGQREPPIEKLKYLATHNGVTLDWLMGLTDDPGPASRTHDPPERPPGPVPEPAPAIQADPRVGRLPSITSADLTNLIEENRDLSAGARAMGEAHKVIADTNAELVRKLMELCKELPGSKAVPAAARAGGGNATKTA